MAPQGRAPQQIQPFAGQRRPQGAAPVRWDPNVPFDPYEYARMQFASNPQKYGPMVRPMPVPPPEAMRAPQAGQMTERVASPRLQELLGANQAATDFSIVRRGPYG
jgi:hypothetical protein